MCGSSGGGTAPPPSPPPTTFSYTAADNSNAQRRQAILTSQTQTGGNDVLGAPSGEPGSTADNPGTGGYR